MKRDRDQMNMQTVVNRVVIAFDDLSEILWQMIYTCSEVFCARPV